MNVGALRELLGRRPFEPFDAVMSTGEVHQVRHPEFVVLLPSRLIGTDPVTDRMAVLSLIHITEARILQPAGKQGGKATDDWQHPAAYVLVSFPVHP